MVKEKDNIVKEKDNLVRELERQLEKYKINI